VAVAAALPAAVVVVVGEDSIVGHALALLLRGSGYDARFEPFNAFDVNRACAEAGLVLLAPGLDGRDGNAVLSSVVAACSESDLPVLELASATSHRTSRKHAYVPWPCRTEELERQIGNVLQKSLQKRLLRQ
jgi:hypothetical protein